MTDHHHPEPVPPSQDSPKLLRSGITIRATADRPVDYDMGDADPLIDLVDITVQVASAHPVRVNLNAAAVAADSALRAVTEPPEDDE